MNSEQEAALQLFRQNTSTTGLVQESHLEKLTVITTKQDGEVIGAALVEHDYDSHSLIHAIAVEESHRREGIGQEIVEKVLRDSPHDVLRTKCPTGIDANKFYQSTGWELERETGDGMMNVWKYTD